MRLSNRNICWSKNDDSEGNAFVELLQLYMEKTVTTLKLYTIVAYPVYIVFLYFSKQFCRHLIDHRNTLVGLHSASKLDNTSAQEGANEIVKVGEVRNSTVGFIAMSSCKSP